LDLAANTASGGDAGGDGLYSIENLIGSNYDDSLIGDSGANALFGGAGDDMLYGGAGSDLLSGDAGADVLDGGAGIDTASYSASSTGVSIDLNTGSGIGGDAEGDELTGIENLIGSDYDDSLTGDAGVNVLSGGDGSDTFNVGAGDGNDTIHGGTGASWTDTMVVESVPGATPGSGWSVELSVGSVVESTANSATLTDDSEGTLTLEDGTQIEFDGIEVINW
jgi:Ca2+-binding RTX toxin-like protein